MDTSMTDQSQMSDLQIWKASHNVTSSAASQDGRSHLPLPEYRRLSRCGREVRRASLSVWLEQVQGKEIHVTWLRPFSISSQSVDLTLSLGNRLQQQLPKISGPTLYSLSWRKKATPAGLPYFQLVASVPRTKGIASSSALHYWNTPAASDGSRGGTGITENMTGSSLSQLVKLTAWPTPLAKTAGPDYAIANREKSGGLSLASARRSAPQTSPTANDFKGSGPTVIRRDGKDRTFDRLDYATEQGLLAAWPTPRARDYHTEGQGHHSPSLPRMVETVAPPGPIRITAFGEMLTGSSAAMESSGQLNPAHSRWLMGFPPEWDDCAAMAMPSSRKQRLNLSKHLEVHVETNKEVEIIKPVLGNDFGGSTTPPEHRDSWRTPPEIFAALNAEFRFVGDVAASDANALHHHYLTERQNALAINWREHFRTGFVWCNPPYSDPMPWVQKATEECGNGIGTVMLVPADASVGWFKAARQACTEIRFVIGGRLAFINAATGKPVSGNNKGSILIIWNPHNPGAGHTGYVERDTLMQSGRIYLEKREKAA